jgi:hypothetical protein
MCYQKTEESATEKHETQHLPVVAPLPQTYEQLSSTETDNTNEPYVKQGNQHSMPEENLCQASFDLTRYFAAVSIQSQIRGCCARSFSKQMRTRQTVAPGSTQSQIGGHTARSSLKHIRTRQYFAAVSIQSQIRRCIARSLLHQMVTRQKVATVSIQSQIRRHNVRDLQEQKRLSMGMPPNTIPKTSPRNNSDSSSNGTKEWQEKQYADSVGSVGPIFGDRKHNISKRVPRTKTSTWEQAKGSTSAQHDFRSILSFWESMANHSPKRTGDDHGETPRASTLRGEIPPIFETTAKSEQQKTLETASAVYF